MALMRPSYVSDEYFTEAEALRGAREGAAVSRQALRSGRLDDRKRQDLLTRAVELEVIPRLLLAQRSPNKRSNSLPSVSAAPSDADVCCLTDLVLHQDQPAASAFVESLRQRGVATERLYLDLLAPSARALGELWEDDNADFVEVSVGLVRLQNVLRDLAPTFLDNFDLRKTGPRALLVPLPGEQHSFGLSMVVQFFRRAGWNVWSGAVATAPELATMVKNEWFGVIGFSVACEDRLEAVATAIRAVRRVSRNRGIGVMVGGPAFLKHPQLAALVGADATAADGFDATVQARNLLSLLATDRG